MEEIFRVLSLPERDLGRERIELRADQCRAIGKYAIGCLGKEIFGRADARLRGFVIDLGEVHHETQYLGNDDTIEVALLEMQADRRLGGCILVTSEQAYHYNK